MSEGVSQGPGFICIVKHCNSRHDSTSGVNCGCAGSADRAASKGYGSDGGQDDYLVLHSLLPLFCLCQQSYWSKTHSWFHLKPGCLSSLNHFISRKTALASSPIAPAARSEEQGWQQERVAEVRLLITSPTCTYLHWCQRANRDLHWPSSFTVNELLQCSSRNRLTQQTTCWEQRLVPAVTASLREDIYSWPYLSQLRRG